MYKADDILKERYQLQQQLGRTATGHQTWLAVDLSSQEKVIIKLLAFSPQMQWEELKLFEREAQTLQAIANPRIPRYRDYFDIDKNVGMGLYWFALVQDYIPGSSLQELLEKGKRFSGKQIRAIATKILEILIYLHELNPPVLHRDIKPSNLILGEDGYIYLIDFGAVQARAAVTGVTFTIVGTSGYSPLEQFWGRAVPSSDIYALGATLIHLLTGIAPADLPQQKSRIYFADKVSIKPNLLAWIEKTTEIIVEDRFTSAREALDALLNYNIVPAKPRSRLDLPSLQNTQFLFNNRIKIEQEDGITTIQLLPYISSENLTNLSQSPAFSFFVTTCIALILISLSIIPLTGWVFLLVLGGMVIILGIILGIFRELIKTTTIILEPDKLSIKKQRSNFERVTLIDYKQNIQGILIYYDRTGKNSNYQICIETDAGNNLLDIDFTKEEADCVAQIIQNWLRS